MCRAEFSQKHQSLLYMGHGKSPPLPDTSPWQVVKSLADEKDSREKFGELSQDEEIVE